MNEREMIAEGMPPYLIDLILNEGDKPPREVALHTFLFSLFLPPLAERSRWGYTYVKYRDVITMSANIAEIGATIARSTDVDPVDLMQFGSKIGNPRGNLEHLWDLASEGADRLLETYVSQWGDEPPSVGTLMTLEIYLVEGCDLLSPSDKSRAAKVAGRRMKIPDSFPEPEAIAMLCFSRGIALARNHPELMARMDVARRSLEVTPEVTKHLGITEIPDPASTASENLAFGRLWVRSCRPDLAHLVGED